MKATTELMMQQFEKMAKAATKEYTPQQLAQMAAYFEDGGDFSTIMPLLFKQSEKDYDIKIGLKIAELLKKDKSLTASVSRYLKIFKEIGGGYYMRVFREAGFDGDTLMEPEEFILYAATSEAFNYMGYSGTAGLYLSYRPTQKLFSIAFEKYPDIMEQIADIKSILVYKPRIDKPQHFISTDVEGLAHPKLAAYLYGKDPHKYGRYKDLLLADITVLFSFLFKCDDFDKEIAESPLKNYFDKASVSLKMKSHFIQQFQELEVLDTICWCMIFSGFKFSEANKLFNMLTKLYYGTETFCNGFSTLHKLVNVIYSINNKEPFDYSVQSGRIKNYIKNTLLEIMEPAGIHKVYIVAYLLSKTNDYSTAEMIIGDDKTLEKHIATSNFGDRYAYYLWNKGKAKEWLPHYEQKFINKLQEKNNNPVFISWLQNHEDNKAPENSKLTPDVVESLQVYYAQLSKHSNVAKKFMCALVENENADAIENLGSYMKSYWSYNIFDFIEEIKSSGSSPKFNAGLEKVLKKYDRYIKQQQMEMDECWGQDLSDVDFTKPEFTTADMNKANEIIAKLNKLKELDKGLRIFGASDHVYEMKPVLTQKHHKAFEKKYGVTLPEDYAWFLRNVGNGGAGPMYGLIPLSILNDVSKEFPFTTCEYLSIPDAEEKYSEGKLDKLYDAVENGTKSICHMGCGMMVELVLKGKKDAVGTYWFHDMGNDAGVFPLENPNTKKPLTFFECYEIWLDRSIKEMEQGKDCTWTYGEYIPDLKELDKRLKQQKKL